MNEVLQTIEHNGQQVVDARNLHEVLGSGRKFADWIKERIEKYGFEEGKSYFTTLGNRSDGLSGKPRQDYLLTLTTAKEIAMVENNEKGREIRLYLIKVEEAWNTPDMVILRGYQALQKKVEAERKARVEAEQRLAIAEPKAAFTDLAIQSKDALLMNDTAKILKLGYGDKTLFKNLRDKGILMTDNVPYQEYIKRGYFIVDENPILMGSITKITKVTKVTQKGMMWLSKIFGKVPEKELFGFDELQKTS